MTVDSYVNMSVDDLTTELNTLQTKGIKPNLQQLIVKLIAYKSINPNDTGLLTKLKNQTTLSRQPATRQPNLPVDLRDSYRSARRSSSSGGKRKSRKSRKSKKSRRRRR